MSIHPQPPLATSELDAVIARAGGVFAWHDGHAVAVNFGSAAGELSACVCAVGVAGRSELVKLALEGPAGTLDEVVRSLAGDAPAPGGTVGTTEAWWCGEGPERTLVLSEPAHGDRLRRRIGQLATRYPGLHVRDLTPEWEAIAVVGRHAGSVLAALGVYGEQRDPRLAAPFSTRTVGGAQALWLLQSDHRALALVRRADAPAVWRAIHAAGRRFGICAVGQEAFARYALLARTHPEL